MVNHEKEVETLKCTSEIETEETGTPSQPAVPPSSLPPPCPVAPPPPIPPPQMPLSPIVKKQISSSVDKNGQRSKVYIWMEKQLYCPGNLF